MAINALQVAWLSRLRSKGILSPGQSIIEFSPQDILASRAVVERYGLRHNPPGVVLALLNEIFDKEKAQPTGIPAFYRLFGIERYCSVDVMDHRADWLRDFNLPVRLGEQYDVATNFGTAEHIFNIGHVFRSMHDALRPGGVSLHILPAFGDIDHGFYNIHPTTYFDVAAANEYTIEDFCYVDRWDIRNKMLEAALIGDFDFDALPIRIEHMKQRTMLQRMVTEQFVANYKDPNTQRFGSNFPGVLYDYCGVALRKNGSSGFRVPMQAYYGGGVAAVKSVARPRLQSFVKNAPAAAARGVRLYLGAVIRAVLRR